MNFADKPTVQGGYERRAVTSTDRDPTKKGFWIFVLVGEALAPKPQWVQKRFDTYAEARVASLMYDGGVSPVYENTGTHWFCCIPIGGE